MGYTEKDGQFNSLSEFLSRVRKACDNEGTPDSRLRKTAGHMGEADDSQGGFLVPEYWADKIYHVAMEGAIVRPRCDAIFKAEGDSLKVTRLVDSDRSSSFFGGVTFSWVSEAGSKDTNVISKPEVGQLELTPHKLVGSCFVSNELEDDHGAFGKFIEIAFGTAIRFEEDNLFINGNGVGQPLGIMNSGFTILEPRQVANSIGWTDVARLARRLLPDSWERAVWLINPSALDELLQAPAPAANMATIFDLSHRMLWGRPFIVTEKCQATGTSGDIILADFGVGHYCIADKEMVIMGSRHADSIAWKLQVEYHRGFVTDETFWKVVLRVDGQPLLGAPITPLYGGETVSPFVALTDTTS